MNSLKNPTFALTEYLKSAILNGYGKKDPLGLKLKKKSININGENLQFSFISFFSGVDDPDRLLLALEPEAASINCRKLRMNQLVPERPKSIFLSKENDNMSQCSDFVLEDSGTGKIFFNGLFN